MTLSFIFITSKPATTSTTNKSMQTSQLGRIAHREILIIIVFRIPYFRRCSRQFSDIKIENLPLDLLKDWPSNLNIATEVFLPQVYSARTKIKHLADGCSRIFTLHSGST